MCNHPPEARYFEDECELDFNGNGGFIRMYNQVEYCGECGAKIEEPPTPEELVALDFDELPF